MVPKKTRKEIKEEKKQKREAEREAKRALKAAKKAEKSKKSMDSPLASDAATAPNKEKKFSPLAGIEKGLASVIDLHDRAQARVDAFLGECGRSIVKEIDDARFRYRGSERSMVKTGFVMTMIICAMMFVFDYFTVYEYAYNGRVLGYVNSEDTVVNLLDVAGERMADADEENQDKITFRAGDNVTFKKVSAGNHDVDDVDMVANKLTYMTDIEVEAYGIYQDGQLLTVLDTEQSAQRAATAAMNHYAEPDQGMELLDVSFNKDVEVRPVNVLLTSVQSFEEGRDQLINGGSFELSHIMGDGETIASISKTYNVEEEKMQGENGEPASELQVGDLVVMDKEVPQLEVKVVEDGTMSEVIKHDTEERNSDELYKGETMVAQEGVDGRQLITGKVTKVNGKIVERDLKSKEVVKEMVTEVILVGTKDKPKTASTGTYIVPIRGNYIINGNGHFGWRWGRLHKGLDFSCATGTPIYAADGGTVTFSGVKSGYGNCIVITHDNGNRTLYGHNSQLLVSTGQKVYQGQEIALAGNTGNSTGSHLHFEIYVGNSVVDPSGYIF